MGMIPKVKNTIRKRDEKWKTKVLCKQFGANGVVNINSRGIEQLKGISEGNLRREGFKYNNPFPRWANDLNNEICCYWLQTLD